VPSIYFDNAKINAITQIVGSEEDYYVMPSTVDFHLLPLTTKRFTFEKSSNYKLNE
jgi:hypothetical protein